MTKGLTASVIRVGNLTGRYSDGHLQINTQDNAFLNRIKTIMQIKVIPDTILDMEMEFTPVDYCSDAIYKIIQYENRKEIVYHLYNHNTINVCNFILILYNMGLKINVVKKEQFNQVIQNIKKKKINLDALSGLYDYLNNDKKNNRIQENIVLSSEQTIKILKELDFLWPSVDREYLSKIIKQIDISKTKGILHE